MGLEIKVTLDDGSIYEGKLSLPAPPEPEVTIEDAIRGGAEFLATHFLNKKYREDNWDRQTKETVRDAFYALIAQTIASGDGKYWERLKKVEADLETVGAKSKIVKIGREGF